MRRTVFVPILAIALTLAGCTSGSTTKRTVTVVNTITGSSAPVVSVPKTTIAVSSPAISVPASTTAKPTPTTTPKPTPTTTKATVAPIVKVDPLKVDCGAILDASDVLKELGAKVGANNNRIRLGAADRGVTGAIRCLYGSPDSGKSAPVRIRLTQYSSAAAATKQIGVDVQASQDGGASVTKPTVNGYPSYLQIIAGGVLEMQYGTWTMSLAVSDKMTANARLISGLPILAGQVLTRIIKNG